MILQGTLSIGYDANNQQTSTSDSSSHVQASYSYDGLGNRVMKQVTSGPTTVYVYDAFGQMAAEYTNASSTAPCITCYLSYDHLGSVRMVTDQTGSHITALHDYFPFGEEIPGGSTYGRSAQQFGATDGVSQRFTGQQRDSENSPALDFFNARYFTAALGRFGSPDPANAGADLLNPQSWNGYGYVLGNPLGLVDPSGMGFDFGGIFQAIGSTLGKLFGLGQDESDSSGDIYDCAVGCTFYDSTTLSSGGRSSTSSSKTPPSIPLPPAKNVNCGRPIMQQQFIKIYSQMGKDLNVKPIFIMTTSLQESGWDLPHVFGTNKLSNGRPLNNLFGMAPGGGNNKPYPSLEAAATDWEAEWGKQLNDNPQTIQAYVHDLLKVPKHRYNDNAGYPQQMYRTYATLARTVNICGTTF